MVWQARYLGIAAGLVFPVIVVAQIQPLPKPVSPSLPDQGAPSPAGAKPSVPANSPLPAGTADAVLSPFLDSQTLGVIKVDLTDIDLPATRDWVVQSVDELRKANKELIRAKDDVREQIDKASTSVEKFRSAGVGRMYVVFSLADLMENRPPFFVVPLQKDADASAVEQALLGFVEPAGGPQRQEPSRPVARRIGQTVVLAAADTISRLKAAAPAQRPDLAGAFDAAGKGQIRIALIPQEGARKALETLITGLPGELGGGSIQIVSRGMQWMSLAMGLPPSPSFRIVVQASDAAAADKLNDVINKAITWAAQRKEGPQEALAFTQMLGGLKTQLHDNQITIDLSSSDVNKLAATIAGQMIEEQNRATRLVVANHLRQLSMAVLMYANGHTGQFPKDLGGDLEKYVGDNLKELYIDPLRPDEKKPYVYLKLADKLSDVKDAQSAVMIYENHTTWDDGINVAFADGHVEWISEEKQFKSMLEETKKSNPQAVEMPQ